MKELKFRCWDNMSNYYFNPSSIDFEKSIVYETRGYDHTNKTRLHRQHILGKTCELEQFINLHDKNGKEIYEGDIVSDGQAQSNHCISGVHAVEIDNGGIYPFSEPGWEGTMNIDQTVIVGNIHENKELLK